METTWTSIDWRWDKVDVMHMEYHSAIKKEQNNAIYSNMYALRDFHTKWCTSERERQIPHNITLYVESKIWHKQTYLQNILTDIENSLVVTKGEEGVEGWRGSLGIADVN